MGCLLKEDPWAHRQLTDLAGETEISPGTLASPAVRQRLAVHEPLKILPLCLRKEQGIQDEAITH